LTQFLDIVTVVVTTAIFINSRRESRKSKKKLFEILILYNIYLRNTFIVLFDVVIKIREI